MQSGSVQDGSPTKPRLVDSACHSNASLRSNSSLLCDPVPHSEGLDPTTIGSSSQPECSMQEEGSSSDEYECFVVIPTSVTYVGPVQQPNSLPKQSTAKARFRELLAKALCKRSSIERLDC